jgi:signal transduction histidine kinase
LNLVRANAELQERNDRLDDFCSTLAHDIRVPLSALSLKLEHLDESQGEALDSKGRVSLKSAVESTRHVLRVVEATYDMSRLRTTRVSMSPLNLRELIERVASEIELAAHRRLEVSCEDMPIIRGNSALLERVFLNVIGNSVKYSDQETVQVRFRVVSREGEDESRYVWIECLDNGPGIRGEDQDGVFLMFRRGSHPRDKDGLGVGLSVVKSVVELHGGEARLGEVMTGERGCRLLISLPQMA